jgi:hypothetical protein
VILTTTTETYAKHEDIEKSLQTLQKDKDRDVVFYAQPEHLQVHKGKEKNK